MGLTATTTAPVGQNRLLQRAESLGLYKPQETPSEAPQEQKKGVFAKANEFVKGFNEKVTDIGIGAVKGLGRTLFGLGKLETKIPVVGPLLKKAAGYAPEEEIKTPEILEATNTAQKIGMGAEQIGEFLIPFGAGVKAASLASKATKIPFVASKPGQLLARSIGEGTEIAAKAAAQKGEAEGFVQNFLIGAAIPPVSAALSGIGKAITVKLPERLYKQVFKVSKDDLELNVRTLAKGKKIDPTLAKEVLDRGLFGSSQNMGVYSAKKLMELESKVQEVAKNDKILFKVPRKNDYITLLNSIKDEFSKRFGTKYARQADQFVKSIQKGNGYIPKKESLELKRFFDGLRNRSSFRLDPTLSGKQDELKEAADIIRRTLRKDKEFAGLMDEERVFIEALDSILEDWAKRGNRKLLNLTDVILGGGGLAAGGPFGSAIGIGAVRGFQQPFTLTGLGQLFKKVGEAIPEGTAPTVTRGVGGVIIKGKE